MDDGDPENKASDSPLEVVRAFYDDFGWKKDEGGNHYLGEILHEDLEATSQSYMDRNEMRYQKAFENGGNLFLDAGCGAEPRLKLSTNFREHVCVDISVVGLKEARRQLGDRGSYVVADLAALPFKEKSFDGVLASHCLYHIDKDIQPTVLEELYRVSNTNKHILVFYVSNFNLISLFHNAGKVMIKLVRSINKTLRRGRTVANPARQTPPLYSYTHNPLWLAKQFPSADVTCLRTLTKSDLQALRKLHLLAPAVYIMSFLEKTFPHLMRYFGKYAAIQIQRSSDRA